MNVPFDEFNELKSLLDALVEDRITPDQVKRLESLVLNHPEAEAYYVQYMSMVADLVGHLDRLPADTQQKLRARTDGTAGEAASTTPVQTTTSKSHPYWWGAAALVGLAAAILTAVNLPRDRRVVVPINNKTIVEEEAEDNSVAVLVQAPGAQWEETGMPTRPGAPLPPGNLRLKSGLAHIEFYCGAIVILEGPAEFKIVSRTEAYCANGKLRARVPLQAQGFSIGTPEMYLVDRGTEFGLSVGGAKKTEVHVFQGRVDLYDPAAKKELAKAVKTGEGVQLHAPGQYRSIKVNPTGFSTAQDVADESQLEIQRRQKDWLKFSEALRKDESLLVYFPFQSGGPMSRTLKDWAIGRDEAGDGAIVGCSWGSGRWPGKEGLEFKGVGHRVRFRLNGTYESLTLMTWVRVDALPNKNNSLMMSDGWPIGSLHWQIGETGTIILGVQSNPRGAHYHAVQKMTPERFGQWLHLAVVYDKPNGTVTHFMDGRPIAQSEVKFDIDLQVGDAELGNWNIATHRNNTPIRNLFGCMDEFMIFSRPVTEEEIGRFFNQGRPPL